MDGQRKKIIGRLSWLLVLFPTPALAIQIHGPPEGIYVHQAAHVCFFVAMLYFAFELRRSHLAAQRGFRLMAWACLFFALWNLDAFVGHWTESLLSPEAFIGQFQDFSQRIVLSSPSAVVFYLAKFDHLILLLALLLFYLGLRKLRLDQSGGQS
jgi:hypothetical protein